MTKLAIEPVYETMTGWNTDITKTNTYANLPQTMKNYVTHINKYLGVDIKYISNGPGREQIIPAV